MSNRTVAVLTRFSEYYCRHLGTFGSRDRLSFIGQSHLTGTVVADTVTALLRFPVLGGVAQLRTFRAWPERQTKERQFGETAMAALDSKVWQRQGYCSPPCFCPEPAWSTGFSDAREGQTLFVQVYIVFATAFQCRGILDRKDFRATRKGQCLAYDLFGIVIF